MTKFLKQTISATLIFISLSISLYLRLSNIDMTPLRLLIDFWWVWIIVAICSVLGVAILGDFKRR